MGQKTAKISPQLLGEVLFEKWAASAVATD
jgi:hypothetical protein